MSTAEADPFGWAGATIDAKFRVDDVVGEGGFGVVYRGQHLGFDEPVAIKVLKVPATLQGAERERFLENFLVEGKVLHRLSRGTVGIVQALDVGAATSPNGTWTPYLILEWLDGSTLERDLKDRCTGGAAPRTLAEAIALLDPAARALGAAHAQGIAHRDVKPANLFLAQIAGRTTLKILDFGIAKVLTDVANVTQAMAETGGSVRSFTPQYGAPEQFHRQFGATGPWTDVFALALVLVEMVSGKMALDGSDTTQLYILSTDPSRRPTLRAAGVVVNDAVEGVLARALTVDPRARYRDAGAFWDALVAAAGASTASGHAEPRPSVPSVPREILASMATGEFLDVVATGPVTAPRAATGDTVSHEGPRTGSHPRPAAATLAHASTVAAPRTVDTSPRPSTTAAPVTASPDRFPAATWAPQEAPQPPANPWWRQLFMASAAFSMGCIVLPILAVIAVIVVAVSVFKDGDDDHDLSKAGPLLRQAASALAALSSDPLVSPSAAAPEPSAAPPTMTLVPAGKLMMGTLLGGKTERPVHEVTLTHAFELDLTEVTAGDFQRCVDAGKCTPGRIHGAHVDDAQIAKLAPACTGGDPARVHHPINCVDQGQAAAYCAFVGKRLPTEAEWEYAARGTDGRDYPWGNAPPSCERGNFARPPGESCGGRLRGTLEVGSLPIGKSPFGALDMAGNVWEWVADGWDPQAYQRGPRTDPVAPFSSDKGVLRGGSWDFDAGTARSTFRLAFESTAGSVSTGFRCARTAK